MTAPVAQNCFDLLNQTEVDFPEGSSGDCVN